jgi:hypothetical protein
MWGSRGCPHRCNGGAVDVPTEVMEEQKLSSQMYVYRSRGSSQCNGGAETVLTDVIEEKRLSSQK